MIILRILARTVLVMAVVAAVTWFFLGGVIAIFWCADHHVGTVWGVVFWVMTLGLAFGVGKELLP